MLSRCNILQQCDKGYGSVTPQKQKNKTKQKKRKKEGGEADTSLWDKRCYIRKEGKHPATNNTGKSLAQWIQNNFFFFREKANGADTPFAGATFNTGKEQVTRLLDMAARIFNRPLTQGESVVAVTSGKTLPRLVGHQSG